MAGKIAMPDGQSHGDDLLTKFFICACSTVFWGVYVCAVPNGDAIDFKRLPQGKPLEILARYEARKRHLPSSQCRL